MTMNWKQWLIVIPARLQSTRLPRKPLADLGGEALIVRVAQRLSKLESAGAKVVVATDSSEIESVVQKSGFQAQMTREDHESGTDRVYEVAQQHSYDYILNVQGDEPFVDLGVLEKLCQFIERQPQLAIATILHKNKSREEWLNPNVVKAVTNSTAGEVLYFSRHSIPFHRDREMDWFWHHQGIYAFRKESLKQFCSLGKSYLEKTEALEQLRALEHGMKIGYVEAERKSIGIDTPEDLDAARSIFKENSP